MNFLQTKRFKVLSAGGFVMLVIVVVFPIGTFYGVSFVNQDQLQFPDQTIVPRQPVNVEALNATPLFEPTRQPRSVDVQTNATQTQLDPLTDWVLTGIMDLGQGNATAWVKKGDNPPQRLKTDDELNGWRVTEIRDGKIYFQQGDKTKFLELKDDPEK